MGSSDNVIEAIGANDADAFAIVGNPKGSAIAPKAAMARTTSVRFGISV